MFRPARVPSLGYATEDRARTRRGVVGRASLTVQPDGSAVMLENQHLRATLRQDSGWGIVSMIDKRTGREVIRSGEVGNALVAYTDDGGLYRFGSEMAGCRLAPRLSAVGGGVGRVLESGPLRARFVADTTVDGRPFRKEYQLVVGEPYLRMISTGSAAVGTSVMVHFPLAGPIDRLIHGTPYHWDRKWPERAGELTFEATHDFLVPEFRGRARMAVFHAGVPAWAVRRDGLVVGALWRNAPQERCDFYGAQGRHTRWPSRTRSASRPASAEGAPGSSFARLSPSTSPCSRPPGGRRATSRALPRSPQRRRRVRSSQWPRRKRPIPRS